VIENEALNQAIHASVHSFGANMAYIRSSLAQQAEEIQPAGVYGTEGPVKLRIATGGAGQTGVLRALAEAFIALLVMQSSSMLT